MANKYYRQNLRNGTNPTKRKSNIAKIMETFGPKKKVKKEKPKKRMFANKGGGADSGRMGGITSPERLQRDKLRAYLSGLGQTGLGGGAEAFTREQQRQDALQIGDLDRLIELEREDEKLQREIDASMAELVAKNQAELEQLMVDAGLKQQLELSGDRRKFIADVLKQVQEDAAMNTELMALETARKEGEITGDAYETQRLEIFKRAMSGLPASYDIETGLGGSVNFTSGSFN